MGLGAVLRDRQALGADGGPETEAWAGAAMRPAEATAVIAAAVSNFDMPRR